MKIKDYPQTSEVSYGSVFLTDDYSGTKKIAAYDLFNTMLGFMESENHRRIFRGKNLGDHITPEQLSSIKNGSFGDLWLGDYWEDSNGEKWRIVDVDYFYGVGSMDDDDTIGKTHHIVVMPDDILYMTKMSDTNSTDGGYFNSKLDSEIDSQVWNSKSLVANVFGDAIINGYKEYFPKTTSETGYPTAGEWYPSARFVIPNEIMMYGSHIFAAGSDGTIDVARYTRSKTQLALFNVCPKFISTPTLSDYWLRDIANKARFTMVGKYGDASYTNASNSRGVRPYFLVG